MKRWVVPVTAVSLVLGALLSLQYKSQAASRQATPSRRVEDLAFMLKTTEKSNAQLSDQVSLLQERLRKLQVPDAEQPSQTLPAFPAMSGPGLEVTIRESGVEHQMDDGTSAVVHAEDLLKIVNELRSGGAEAVSLNGHRLTEVSEVSTAAQHIVVNKTPVVAPYRILAIGPAEDMKATLALRGGVVDYLQFYGIEVVTKAHKKLVVAALPEARSFRFAKPADASVPPPAP